MVVFMEGICRENKEIRVVAVDVQVGDDPIGPIEDKKQYEPVNIKWQ